MSKRRKLTVPKIPKLSNVEQIDFSILEKQSSPGEVDQYFSKAELANMSAYEKLRYRNMKKNYEMMIALGLPALMPEFMKGPKARKRKIKKEESDESDEDWTPDLERRKSNRVQKQTSLFCIPYKEKEKKVKNIVTAEKDKSLVKNKKDKPEKHEYPLRKLPHTNYMALEVPDDDEYLYCEDCNKEYRGDCPVHGELFIVTDSQVPEQTRGTKDQAVYTLPSGLTIRDSCIEGAGLGVWALKDFPVRTRFGPYKGKIVKDIDQAHSSGYAWQVYKDGKPSHFVDAFEKQHSNWMRFVNCARTESEQNLAAYQYQGEIYYRTYKEILAGSELLVWYGHEYGQDLGIYRNNVSLFQSKIVNGEVIYPCTMCKGKAYSSLEYLQKHARFSHGVPIQPVQQRQNMQYLQDGREYKSSGAKRKDKSRFLKRGKTTNEQNHDIGKTNNAFHKLQKSWLCSDCNMVFNEGKYFIFHMVFVHKSNNLQKHYRACTGDKPYMKCGNGLTNQNLQIHNKTHTGDKPYKCGICGKGFTHNSKFQKHYRTHTEDKPYKCEICGKGFTQNSNLQIHYRTHTGDKPYKCDICGKGFTQNSNLQIHYRTHIGDKPYKCEICGKGFTQNSNLQIHYRTHIGDKPYKCDIFGKGFIQNSHLQTHYRTHTGDKPYKCDICGKGFIQNSHLQTHYRTHTGDKPYKCDICGKGFTDNSNLQIHYRTHTGDKPYKCDICGKDFTQTSNLQIHYRTHTGDKPYKCDICCKGFTRNGNLQVHYRTHTGDKPYKCDICGKGFTQTSNLQIHHRTHTRDKPYKCDICGKGCTQNSDLQKHYRTHTGDKPYKCDICGKGFTQNSSLHQHYRTHTGDM